MGGATARFASVFVALSLTTAGAQPPVGDVWPQWRGPGAYRCAAAGRCAGDVARGAQERMDA